MFGECVVWTFVGSSSWSYSHYILWMWCLNFVRVQFLILFPLYLVDVLSELLYCPVPGLTLVIFGECVVWTFIGSSSWFYSCYIWWMCCLHFCRGHFLVLLLIYLVDVLSEILYGPLPGLTPIIFGGCVVSTLIGSSSWFYSRYIRWMGCLKLYRVQFLVLLLLSLVDVLSERLLGPVPSFTPTIFGGCVVWTCVGSSSWFYSHYIWWIWSGSLSYSRSIWWMCFLNFSRVQFVVLLPL
jgi:hypothetical protein